MSCLTSLASTIEPITITGLQKLSFSDQTGNFSYALRASINQTDGVVNMGISGLNTLNYKFANSKIYDNNDQYIGNYNTNDIIVISGNVTSGFHDVYINGEPIYYNRTKSSGTFNYIYVNPVNASVKFLGYTRGALPNYTVIKTGAFYNSGDIITGSFINNNPNVAFRVFSGKINAMNPLFVFSGVESGSNINTGNFTLIATGSAGGSGERTLSHSIPLILYTNFGELEITYTATGVITGNI